MRSSRIVALSAVLILAAVTFFAALAHQHDKPASGGSVTVTGELVDMACYMSHPETARGESHRGCAQGCLTKGLPMSVLTSGGDLYLLLPDHDNEKVYEQARDWAADQVEVKGRLVNQGGIRAIIVADSKKVSK